MITIAQRLRPFSHVPGSRCLLPGTSYVVEAYPTLIRIKELDGTLIKETRIDIEGPFQQFTHMQDLERGCVTVFSERYTLHILPTLKMVFQKTPPLTLFLPQERLSLGSHKKQDWEGIRQRLDFKEILPIWFRLGSLLKLPPRMESNTGMFSLLHNCDAACKAHRPEEIIPAFENLFLCGFSHFLIPRATDEDHRGILKQDQPSSISPIYLLSEGAALIRSFLVVQSGQECSILPDLPPELFSGRMINVAVLPYGMIDFEWSKKAIRRLEFHAAIEGEILFRFPPAMKHYRLRKDGEVRGKSCTNGESLVIKSGSHYLLDQFQK